MEQPLREYHVTVHVTETRTGLRERKTYSVYARGEAAAEAMVQNAFSGVFDASDWYLEGIE